MRRCLVGRRFLTLGAIIITQRNHLLRDRPFRVRFVARSRRIITRRRAISDCRAGHHRFGPGNEAGGGIIRRICRHCGILSIDLTGVAPSRLPDFNHDRKSGIPERVPAAND